MNKNKFKGLLYIILGAAIIFIIYNSMNQSSNNNHPLITDFNVDSSNINTIKIHSSVTNIIVTETDDTVISASLEQRGNSEFNALTLVTEEKQDTVEINVEKQTRKFRIINISGFNSKLHVKIPKSFNGKLDIVTTTGKTEIMKQNLSTLEIESTTGMQKIADIVSEQIDLESTTGNIHVENVIATKLEAESTTGNIHIDSNIESLDVETTTGNIYFKQDNIVQNSEFSSTTGNVNINLNESPTSLTVKFNTTTGNAKINKDKDSYNMIQNSKSDTVFQYGAGETELKVETTTGNFNWN